MSKNTNLKRLNCYKNKLTELNVNTNNNLESLDCSDNKITSLDVSENTDLKELWCGNNKLTKLDVKTNKKLESLDCYGNQISIKKTFQVKFLFLASINNNVPEAPARRILLRDGRGRVIRGDYVHRTVPDTIPKGLDGLPRPHGGRALQDAPQPLQVVLGEDQVVRAGLHRHPRLPPGPRHPIDHLGQRGVADMNARPRGTGHLQHHVDGQELRDGGVGPQEIPHPRAPGGPGRPSKASSESAPIQSATSTRRCALRRA